MKERQQPLQPLSRRALYLTVACSLLGTTQARSAFTSPLAFATPTTAQQTTLKRERESDVRLFSRGPDTLLSAATLAWTADSVSDAASTRRKKANVVTDPFDPDFRPYDDTFWDVPALETIQKPTTLTVPQEYVQDSPAQYKIFCDLDGVLVDFEHGVRKICQASTSELAKTTMWHQIAQSNTDFFAELPWMPDGQQLWNAIKDLKPDILTGVPDLRESRQHKFQWCRENLGMDDYRHVDMAGYGYNHANVNGVAKACPKTQADVTNVITCWSYNKHHESGRHAILIDDRIALKESWESKGGIFVHHTDTLSTLRQLRELGVLGQSDDEDSSSTLRP